MPRPSARAPRRGFRSRPPRSAGSPHRAGPRRPGSRAGPRPPRRRGPGPRARPPARPRRSRRPRGAMASNCARAWAVSASAASTASAKSRSPRAIARHPLEGPDELLGALPREIGHGAVRPLQPELAVDEERGRRHGVEVLDHRVHRPVQALHHLPEGALVVAGVGALAQAASHRRGREAVRVPYEPVERRDADVQALVDAAEVALGASARTASRSRRSAGWSARATTRTASTRSSPRSAAAPRRSNVAATSWSGSWSRS